jgi:hypothetical protein
MKRILPFCILAVLFSCNQTSDTKKLQAEIDSLQEELANTYKPGFGEFMGSVQVHHAKLWFAGTSGNWELADFEIHEIKELLEGIKKYNTDRHEVKAIGMMDPAIDSVSEAIMRKNLQLFKDCYLTLTNTCNSCHKTTEHGFNVITIPTSPPMSNQNFSPVQ